MARHYLGVELQGLVLHGCVRLGKPWFHELWYGSARFCYARRCELRLGLVMQSGVQYCELLGGWKIESSLQEDRCENQGFNTSVDESFEP